MVSGTKNPGRVAAGRATARMRWGQHMPRTVALDSLEPAEQAVVRALIRLRKAREAQEMTPSDVSETSSPGVVIVRASDDSRPQ